MHPEAHAYIAGRVDGRRHGRVIEVGGRDLNGSVRPLFDCDEYVSVDLYPGPGVDVVADFVRWAPTQEPADAVVCCEVLEHAPDAAGVVRSACRLLKPGGVLYVTCATAPRATHSGVDGAGLRPGEWYANVPPEWLVGWCESAGVNVTDLEVHLDRGDLYLTAEREAE